MTPIDPTHASAVRRSKADVTEAALDLLDEVGLPDLTMRRIAERLGLQASALYRHYANKQLLLAAVSARILDTVPIAAGQNPGESSASLAAGAFRDSLLAHRDGAEVVSSSLALGLIEPPAKSAIASALIKEGVPRDRAQIAADTITHYVVGYAFHEQQRAHADMLGILRPEHELRATDLVSGEENVDHFALGVGMIIAGASMTSASLSAANVATDTSTVRNAR